MIDVPIRSCSNCDHWQGPAKAEKAVCGFHNRLEHAGSWCTDRTPKIERRGRPRTNREPVCTSITSSALDILRVQFPDVAPIQITRKLTEAMARGIERANATGAPRLKAILAEIRKEFLSIDGAK